MRLSAHRYACDRGQRRRRGRRRPDRRCARLGEPASASLEPAPVVVMQFEDRLAGRHRVAGLLANHDAGRRVDRVARPARGPRRAASTRGRPASASRRRTIAGRAARRRSCRCAGPRQPRRIVDDRADRRPAARSSPRTSPARRRRPARRARASRASVAVAGAAAEQHHARRPGVDDDASRSGGPCPRSASMHSAISRALPTAQPSGASMR